MKKLLPILLILMLLLTACGKKGPEEANTDVSPTPASDITDVTDSPSPDPTGDSGQNTDNPNDIDIDIPTEIKNPSPLTGLEMDKPYQPIAVMIENDPPARPQSGLIDADIVYEAHCEGGISRFMAIFQSKYPEIAGPVRSVRHYYMWMAQEWNAYLVHYGQSFIAEDMFGTIKVKRLNGLYTDKYFWRDNSRKAPHNVYININDVNKLIDFDQSAEGFDFVSENKRSGPAYSLVTIPYNKSVTLVEYKYDDSQKLNLRFINGKKDVDKETGKQLFAKNIIVQYAEHSILEPGAGYRDVKLIGSGKAKYFMEGQWFEGTWERKKAESRTVYYDQDGKEMEFLRGNTWIEIVQTDMKITIE